MIRIFLMTCVLAVAPVLSHAQIAGPGQGTQPISQTAQPSAAAPARPPQPAGAVVEVPPDAVVITIHGICSGKGADSEKSDSCQTTITRRQFETILVSMNIGNQAFTPAAMRSIAESYAQLMTLADAGEKAGVDKDPRFQELLKVVRTRTMAEAYRRVLMEKYGTPSPEEIKAYYDQNINKYEQLKIDRIFIPLVNPKRPQDNRAEFEKKARQVANDMRERAAKGEDMNSLQAEAYRILGITSPPPTDLGGKRKGNLPPLMEHDIFALKPGEVTKVEVDLSGFSIYKVRSREAIPLDYVKSEIGRELSQKGMEAAVKSVTGRAHAELNEDFFKPHPTGPVTPQFRPAPHVIVEPGPPAAAPATGSGPSNAAAGSSVPPANSNSPTPQKPASPK